jgi:hypothetical protein
MTRFLKNADVTGYISQTSVTSSLLKTDSAGKLVAAVAGTDYNAPGVTASAGTLVREIRNTTGATLTKGTVIYISGATGNKPTVSKALATGDSTSAQTFGLCQTDIANNSNGNVVVIGDITGIDTSAFTEGAQLYLSSTTAGTYTTTKQLAPAHLVYIGVVTRSHPTQGQIEVKIQNGYELDEIHDVSISSLANNQGLFYESATDLWKNKTIAAALGYTPADDSTVVKLTGNQTVAGVKTFTSALLANNPSEGATGEGLIAGQSFKIDATGTGQRAIMYVVSKTLSNTYGSGLIAQYANSDGDKAFGFNLNTAGGFELYVKNTAFNRALAIANTMAATFGSSVTATSFVKSDGTSAQFLKADGSVDSNTYLTTGTASSTYLPLAGGTLTGALIGTSATFSNLLSTSYGTARIEVNSTTNSENAGFRYSAKNSAGTTKNAGIYYVSGATSATTFIAISADDNNYQFNVLANGNVLIGKELDGGFKLEVNGTGRFSEALSGTTATFSGNVTVGNAVAGTNVKIILNGVASKAAGFEFQQNGTAQWYLGNGIASEDNNFELYNSNGTMAMKIIKSTNAIAFQGAATFSSSVTAASFVKTGGTSTQFLMADGSVSTGTTGGITGTLTTNKIPKATGTNTLGNSIITELNNAITVSGAAVDNAVASFINTDTGSHGIYVKADGFAFKCEPTSLVGGVTINSDGSASFTGDITANKFIKVGGTSAQFLKADGSVDSSTYLTSYTEADTLATVTGRGNTTTTRIGVLTSTAINLAGAGNSGTWVGGVQDATTGWSISNNGIGLKADDTTYATVGIASSNGILYFGRTTAGGVGTLTSWLEVNSGGVANFIRARPQHNGSNLALVSETLQLAGGTLTGKLQINANWGGTNPERFTIRGTYPSIALRTTQHDSNWLIHNESDLAFYYAAGVDSDAWARRLTLSTSGVLTTGLLISQGPGGNYNENIRLPGSTAVISFNTSGTAGVGSYNIVSQTNFQIRNASGTQVFVMDQSGNLTMTGTVTAPTFSGALSGNATSATTATLLNSSNYINQRGSTGSWNTDFSSTPAGSANYGGDVGANSVNGPGGSWWIQQNFRHTNGSNLWGVQVAWGWEDNPNRLATRSISGGNFGSWVYYLNSSNFTSYVNAPNAVGNGNGYYNTGNWMQMNGNFGIFWPGYYGLHLYPNNEGSYGSLGVLGEKNGWRGIHFGGSTGMTLMMNETEFGFHRQNVGWVGRFTSGTGHFDISGNAATANQANSLPTRYDGLVSSNPQQYFNQSTGVKVAMTGAWSVWSDTLWINGYAGGDVLQMCALHTLRNGQPRMAISVQASNSSSYGGFYEFITTYNIANQTVANTNSVSAATGNNYTWTGLNYFLSNRGGYSGVLDSASLQAYATGGNSAFMSFHRAGSYAVNMGLDADNVLRIGGWSASANRLQLDMSGNLTVAASVNAPSGYVSAPNPWGTADSAFFPNGISTAGGTNWIYGYTYIGNAPSNGSGHEFFTNGNARSTGSYTASSFFESSDMRLKTLIDESAQIAGIENLQAKLYEKDGKIELGYFAQDAQELMPYAITENAEGYLNLSYREVHTAKIARLEKELEELKAKLK